MNERNLMSCSFSFLSLVLWFCAVFLFLFLLSEHNTGLVDFLLV